MSVNWYLVNHERRVVLDADKSDWLNGLPSDTPGAVAHAVSADILAALDTSGRGEGWAEMVVGWVREHGPVDVFADPDESPWDDGPGWTVFVVADDGVRVDTLPTGEVVPPRGGVVAEYARRGAPVPVEADDAPPLFVPDVALACHRCGSRRPYGSPEVCASCAARPTLAPPTPDLWPGLVATVERAMHPAPTLDVRQHGAATKLRARVLEMLATRAAEAGPVASVPATAAIDGVIDATLGVWVMARMVPERMRPVFEEILSTQLRVLIALASVSRPQAAKGEG